MYSRLKPTIFLKTATVSFQRSSSLPSIEKKVDTIQGTIEEVNKYLKKEYTGLDTRLTMIELEKPIVPAVDAPKEKCLSIFKLSNKSNKTLDDLMKLMSKLTLI